MERVSPDQSDALSQRDDLPIIDAHHHYWDPISNNHPWLREKPLIPFRYGDYTEICKPFMPSDYQALTQKFGVIASVTMEGEWDESDLVAESQWMSELAETHGTPSAHVARAILHDSNVSRVLERHAQYPLVRAIRHKPTVASHPQQIEIGRSGSLSDPRWRAGYRLLRQHGFHFELQAPWWHVDELLDLIDTEPEIAVVINHGFLPADRSKDGLAGWKRAIRRAAEAPNVFMKISGLGMSGRRWILDDHKSIIYALLEAFDVDRAMFGSNFPVDGLVGSFDTIYTGYRDMVSDIAHSDQLKLFRDNAARVYRLTVDSAPL
ncbi:MAG: amidohydrolase family protein [Hyphomicrobiaceae bacterium]